MAEDIYIVKTKHVLRREDVESIRDRFREQLPGRVVVIDASIEDVYKLEPQDGQALVRMLAEEVLPEWRETIKEEC